MEPATFIAIVLALGATAVLKRTAKPTIKDAYAVLKRLVEDLYGEDLSSRTHLARLEAAPDSWDWRAEIAGDLARAGADRNGEVLWRAIELLDAVQAYAPETAGAFDVNLEEVWPRITPRGPQLMQEESQAEGGDQRPQDVVHFTVYHPKEVKPEVWYTLLAYVHILQMQSTVKADAKQRLEVRHGCQATEANQGIARGAEIIIVPELPGCRFNPPSARLLWLEDWYRVEFRLQAQPDLTGFELGKAVNGLVAFYVESVLVGEASIWACISNEADTTAADAPASTASAEPYEAIFVSYAHEDSVVVDRLCRAYKALGMEFLRDVESLRSGEKWNPALFAMIEQADIFQLYWSRAAQRSRYVKQEWRHALKQERSHFIRPLYWQVPMPQPPSELAQLHFSYFQLA